MQSLTANSLSFIEGEVARQPTELASLRARELEPATSGSIFIGAGDSYAVALASFYLSSGKFLAFDPYAISASPSMAAGRDVYFISVSGRTTSNCAAARTLRGIARKRIAITANEESPLAQEVDEALLLPYQSRPRILGTLSFTLALLTTLKISIGDFPCDFGQAYAKAKVQRKSIAFSERGTTYFLGNNAAHAVAVYSAAKVYEILGERSQAQLLEEFSHMELFSLRRPDSVNIFSLFDPARVGGKLRNALKSEGYAASLLEPYNSSVLETLFHFVFLCQLSTLGRAKANGLKRPYFLGAKKKLRVSDSLIY